MPGRLSVPVMPSEKGGREVSEETVDPLEAKKKAFAEAPENFIELKELVIAAARDSEGRITTLVNAATRVDLMLAVAELTRAVDKVITYNEMQVMKERAKLVQPSTSTINRLRGAFGKKG